MSIQFTTQRLSPVVASALTSVAVTDLNRDGQLDLVVGGGTFRSDGVRLNTGTLAAFLGDGSGNFGAAVITTSQQLGAAESLAVGDFNNDGNPDVVTTGTLGVTPSNVFVALGNGRGEFTPAGNLAVEGSLQSIAVGDVNGDGRLDAVTANGEGQTVSVLLGDGSGALRLGRNLTVQGEPQAVVLQDLNGDGQQDIAVVSNQRGRVGQSRLTVLLGNGQGDFVTATSTVLEQNRDQNQSIGDFAAAIATGDFDQNGRLDIAVSAAGKLSILEGNPSRKLDLVYQLDQAATALYVGDFNGDGQPDLASVGLGYNTYRPRYYLGSGSTILLGDGSGGFSRAVVYDTAINTMGLAVGDVDQNRKPDLVLSSDLIVLLNRTTQTDAIAIGETNRILGQRKTFVDTSSERASVTIDLERRRLTLNTRTPLRRSLPQKISEAIGTRQDDRLRSRQSGGFLNGWAGDDQIVGLSGSDRLLGGAGNDQLTGGDGADRFIFSATPNYPEGLETQFGRRLLGLDSITDFRAGSDKIVLDAGTFTALRAGRPIRLATVGRLSEAKTSRGLITYVRETGRLYYNANGTAAGFGGGGLFAILQNSLSLGAGDFQVFL